MRLLMIIFYCLVLLIGISFAVLNAASVAVNFYFTTFNMPISVLIATMMAIGILIGSSLVLYRYWRLKINYHRLKAQLKLTEKEIQNLRIIPLKD